ncbi:MAG TPA: hypothetical protein VGQ11_03585 [Candidatus Acidoferrales bacterium]|nr:hypothetical protein [Candidatus Acidoferrales bacterium]
MVSLQPNAAQQKYARERTARNIILKARQVGMTTYIAARFFLSTIRQPGTVTLQIAHSLESAQQIFRIVHRFVEHLHPDELRRVRLVRANVRELAFAGVDSRYIVDTAGNPNAGRGLTIHNLHASEVALWPGNPQETMAALLAAVVPGGAVDIESTPHGAGGYFHSEWLRAKAGEGYKPHFFPWWMEPAYQLPLSASESVEPHSEDEKLLIEREKLVPEQIKFRRRLAHTFANLAPQEYAETDTECFLVSGRPVFDVLAIDARLRELAPPLRVAQNGAEAIWLEPQPSRSYVIGADVAEGGADGDFSAVVVLDLETGLQCAELMARWPLARFAQELARLGDRYNGALIAVERNNHGHAILYALQHQFNYLRLYRHAESDGGAGKLGWLMNARTRPQAIGALGKMLRDAAAVFSSRRLLEQCRSFAYGEDGEMAALPGTTDDLVIAAAIACAVREQGGGMRLAYVPR